MLCIIALPYSPPAYPKLKRYAHLQNEYKRFSITGRELGLPKIVTL